MGAASSSQDAVHPRTWWWHTECQEDREGYKLGRSPYILSNSVPPYQPRQGCRLTTWQTQTKHQGSQMKTNCWIVIVIVTLLKFQTDEVLEGMKSFSNKIVNI